MTKPAGDPSELTYLKLLDSLLAKQLVSTTIDKMSQFLSSGDVEAQERVCLSFVC